MKKKITETKFNSTCFCIVCRFKSRKEFKKKEIKIKKLKFYSKLYTEFLSFPFFLGIEDGSYFTIVTLSIYIVKRNLAKSSKSSRWNSQKKAQFSVLGRDHGLMSRHGFPLSALVQSRPCCFGFDQIPFSCLD